VDRRAVGVIEAKPEGTTLSGVEWQSRATPPGCRPTYGSGRSPSTTGCRSSSRRRGPRSTSPTATTRSRGHGGSSRSPGRRRSRGRSATPRSNPPRRPGAHGSGHATAAHGGAAAGADHRHRGDRAVPGRAALQPLPGADGHRCRQDLHRRDDVLPPPEARRLPAHPLPGRSEQPRHADPRRVPELRDAGRRPAAHRAPRPAMDEGSSETLGSRGQGMVPTFTQAS
jgi:hypothetical protein